MKRCPVVLFLLIFVVACGSIESTTPEEEADIDPDIDAGVETTFLFATDFASSGQLYTADPATVSDLSNSGVTLLGSSAVIRLFDKKLYILHDGFSVGSSDNVQIIDPANGFETLGQFSTGNGTNPHDVVVVGNQAYISLYSPEFDSEAVDESGNPSDLIVMNLDTGAIEERISFSSFLNDDGAKTARADAMALSGDLLYVCLQDLEGDAFEQNTAGKIGVVNTETNAIEQVITLQGRNPVDIQVSFDTNRLFVALQAPYDFALGNFDTSLAFGGIEIVPLDNTANTVLLNDEELGGYVEKLVIPEGSVFAVVSEMDPITFSFTSDIINMAADNETIDGTSVFLTGSSDVREITADSLGHLWVARRTINADDGEASDPKVDVIDSQGNAVGASLVPVVPVVSIAIGEI